MTQSPCRAKDSTILELHRLYHSHP